MKRVSLSIGSRPAVLVVAAGILGGAVMIAPPVLGDELKAVAKAAPPQTISALPPSGYVSPGHPPFFYRPDYVASLSPHTVVGGGIGVGAGAANAANGHGGPGGPGSPGR
jgi:hypothetical protein